MKERGVALTDSEDARSPARFGLADLPARIRAWLSDRSHGALAQRVAGTAFAIRLASAALLYLSQVLFARWMGSFEFGVYVYVWTWVLLIGGLFELGLAQGAQRFIPEYLGRKQHDRLRGFLTGSRWLVAGVATAGAAVAATLVLAAAPWLDDYIELPLYLACLCLPFYALTSMQEGIGRSYNWFGIALAPPYILRPLLLLAAMAAAFGLGLPVDAETAMLAAVAATWASTIVQLLMLDRRLAGSVEPGPRRLDVKGWLSVSIPIFLVESFYLLLSYTDVLVLQQFRSPQELAVYYAAAKTLALVAFVSFAVSAAVAHRFTEYHVKGDRARLEAFLAQSIRWTFWPSLAALALILAIGPLLLRLFGPDFADGYPVMFVLAVGLVARAAVGPVDRLLNMLDHQRTCATIYALAFALNLGLCVALVPPFGGLGAAIATSTALTIESVLLFVATKRRLGLHVFVFRDARKLAR
jgi:O-antigen/teichoic acid export membrane protein